MSALKRMASYTASVHDRLMAAHEAELHAGPYSEIAALSDEANFAENNLMLAISLDQPPEALDRLADEWQAALDRFIAATEKDRVCH